jgi:Flp pilus assembly protein TadD
MYILIANSARRTLPFLLLACCSFHVYAQYPGPAEDKPPAPLSATWVNGPWEGPHDGLSPSEYGVQQSSDVDAVLPAPAGQEETPAFGPVSVAELKHPLSRKGRSLITKAQKDLHAGKTTDGISELSKALDEPSAVPYAHSLLGAEYLKLGRVPEAISELEDAVQILPISMNYSNLGYAYLLSGDADRGEQDLGRALQLDSSSPQTHFLLGLLLLDRQSRTREACDQLQRAQRAVHNAQVALAVCYERAGQDDAADRLVKAFVGSGDASRIALWKRWVHLVAGQPHPSLAFGLRTQ